MFWVRGILFSLPLWLILAGVGLFRSVAGVQFVAESDALVHAIDQPIGDISPLSTSDGLEGEIQRLLFEPLLRRDERGMLVPNIITTWSSRTIVTIRCESEEAAGEAEARIRADEAPLSAPRPVAVERLGSVITAAYDIAAPELAENLLKALPQRLLGNYLSLHVKADHSIEKLISAWLESTVMREQVATVDFSGDSDADLFVSGDTEKLLENLQTYLKSNPASAPQLSILGKRCHTVDRETILGLRPEVFWHDGHPFSAEDVLFSFNTLVRANPASPLEREFAFVGTLMALDAQRLRYDGTATPVTMMESWEKLPVLPAHLLQGIRGPEAEKTFAAFLSNPIGLGPYRLANRRQDGGMTLVAHTQYFSGTPREPLIRYKNFSSLESILLSLRDQTLDLLEADSRMANWELRHPNTLGKVSDLPRFQTLVIWNLTRPPFDSAPLRKALAQALDLNPLYGNGSTQYTIPSTGLFAIDAPFSPKPMPLLSHDLAEAKQTLTKLGYSTNLAPDQPDTKSQGRPLSFSLLIDKTDSQSLHVADTLVKQWAASGIHVEVVATLPASLYTERLPQREFDAVLLRRQLAYGRDQREIWHSEGSGNLAGLSNAEVDHLTEALCLEEDWEKCRAITQKLQEIITGLQPALFLYDSGRISTFRTGSLEVFPPSAESPQPMISGAHRIDLDRPWWVRRESATPSE